MLVQCWSRVYVFCWCNDLGTDGFWRSTGCMSSLLQFKSTRNKSSRTSEVISWDTIEPLPICLNAYQELLESGAAQFSGDPSDPRLWEREKTQAAEVCSCVGPCSDRTRPFVSHERRWSTSWNELELRKKSPTICDQTIFCISYLAFCWFCIALLYISIFIHILNDLVKLVSAPELRKNALKSIKIYLALILIQSIFSPLII